MFQLLQFLHKFLTTFRGGPEVVVRLENFKLFHQSTPSKYYKFGRIK